MMTKFILHGGFAKGTAHENNGFFGEVLRSAPKETKILLVYFAKETEYIEKNIKEDTEQFNKNKGDRTLIFDIAREVSFSEQVQSSDVVYLHGGHSGKILDVLRKFTNLKQIFSGKIIAGDSAGANVLASGFYSQKIGVSEGLGLIPIKIISHYQELNKHKLDQIKPKLETLLLAEYQFKVFEIDL